MINAYRLLTAGIFLTPSVIVLSGQAAVPVFLLLVLYPVMELRKQGNRQALLQRVRSWSGADLILLLLAVLTGVYGSLISGGLDAWFLLGRILLLCLMGLIACDYYQRLIPRQESLWIFHWAYAGVLLGMLVFLVEINSDTSISRFFVTILTPEKEFDPSRQAHMLNRGLCFLSIWTWAVLQPLLIDLRRRLFRVVVLLGCLWLVVFSGYSETAQLAVVCTSVVFLLGLVLKNRVHIMLIGGLLLSPIIFFVFVWGVQPQLFSERYPLQPSALARICIWKWGLDAALDNLGGHGLDSSKRPEFSNKKRQYLCIQGNDRNHLGNTNFYYGLQHHPHQNLLQLFFEFGFWGPVIFLLAYLRAFKVIMQRQGPFAVKLAAINLLLAYFLVGSTGYGIWQNWLIAVFLLSLLAQTVLGRSFASNITVHSKSQL